MLLDADKFGWLIPVAFFASGLFFGLFVAIPVWICGFFKDVFARFLGMATLLVLFEWLRSFVLTGFPWNLFGSVLAFSDDLIQIADVFGVYGLSWIVIVVASSPVMLLSAPKWSKISALLVPLILCGIVYLYGKAVSPQITKSKS